MTTVKELGLVRLRDTDLALAEHEVDVRGSKVVDDEGNDLGTVSGLFVDTEDRSVRLLLVRGGGFLGFGDRELLIPIEAIRDVEDDVVQLGHPGLQIAHAPAYRPELVDKPWYWDGIYGWYGYLPFWGGPIGWGSVPPPPPEGADNDDEHDQA